MFGLFFPIAHCFVFMECSSNDINGIGCPEFMVRCHKVLALWHGWFRHSTVLQVNLLLSKDVICNNFVKVVDNSTWILIFNFVKNDSSSKWSRTHHTLLIIPKKRTKLSSALLHYMFIL